MNRARFDLGSFNTHANHDTMDGLDGFFRLFLPPGHRLLDVLVESFHLNRSELEALEPCFVYDNDSGGLYVRRWLGAPGATRRLLGSNAGVEGGRPWSASWIGLVPEAVGVGLSSLSSVWVVPFTLASSASSSKLRCWLDVSGV